MEKKKTSIFDNGLIWFGASVSLAEILTGTYLAPLGFGKGLLAIIIGHIIGFGLMFFAGMIGAKTEKSSMETVKISFGQKGSMLFSGLNVLQLVGWTAIMIINGAIAAHSVLNLGGQWIWSLIIGMLIILWVLIGIRNLGKVNLVAMTALFGLTIVMSVVIFGGGTSASATGGMSFGAAVELSVAMPLSWMPLIADYTRTAKRKKAATFVSAGVYFFGSCWMYVIGLGAALFTGESDIALIMLKAGLGIAGLLIIVLSTVTTTFLDAVSAGVSAVSISPKISEKWVAVTVGAIGMILAIFAPVSQFESFLYLIGSVFAPMLAILITDFYILKKDNSHKVASTMNLILWAIGFAIYRVFMQIDIPVGSTLPVMVIVSAIVILTNKIFGGKKDVR